MLDPSSPHPHARKTNYSFTTTFIYFEAAK
jgi:hypothetical protein